MGLDEVPGEHLIRADAAVVGALRWREAARGPAEGPQVRIQQDVLLLDAEPRLVVLALVVGRLALHPVVALCNESRHNLDRSAVALKSNVPPKTYMTVTSSL